MKSGTGLVFEMAEYRSFSEWNDAYTKALQKRNKLEREHAAAWRDPVKQDKLATKLEAAKQAAEAIRTDPNRPASAAMQNTSRRLI